MIDLDELMRLRKAATPGPWKSCTDEVYVCGELSYYDYVGNAEGKEVVSRITRVSDEDGAYICAACNAVPELVARIRELESKISKEKSKTEDKKSAVAAMLKAMCCDTILCPFSCIGKKCHFNKRCTRVTRDEWIQWIEVKDD